MMRFRRILIAFIMGCIVLTGCDKQNNDDSQSDITNQNNSANQINEISDQQDEPGEQKEAGEVYYSDLVNASVSKYPELNTTDIVIYNYGYGPMIVSPYASDDVIRAVTHVICETDIPVYCYGDYLYDDYHDDFTGYDFEKIYEIIQARVDEFRFQADEFDEQLTASLASDSTINISSDGEYYYILDMENFEESADAIQASLDRQSEVFTNDMRFDSEYYFGNEGRNFTGGYRGLTYSIYLDSYSPDNKIFEYYYWKSKNEWVDIYNDLYKLLIYDYTAVSEKVNNQTDSRSRLTCTAGMVYYMNFETGFNCIDFTYRMWSEEFESDEAIELAYELYTDVRNANETYNTHKIYGIYIDIDNFTEYNKEYNKVNVFMPFEDNYSQEEFEKIILDNIETDMDDEPV